MRTEERKLYKLLKENNYIYNTWSYYSGQIEFLSDHNKDGSLTRFERNSYFFL